MVEINRKELATLFSNGAVNGNTIINITTRTKPTLTGGMKNPQKGRISKISTANVMIFQNKNQNGYSNMVKRRLEKEGKSSTDFQLKERRWGTRIPNTPIIEHTKDGIKKLYLEVIYFGSTKTIYKLDDIVIDKSKIQGLKVSKPSQGGLDDSVIIRTISFDNILNLSINKEKYFIA